MRTIEQARALPSTVKVLLVTNAVSAFGGGLVLPFLWVYLTGVRHLAQWIPAATLAVQALTAVAGGLLWGVLVDRLPQRVIAPLVMTLAGLGTALYAVVDSAPLALTAAVVYGLGISGVGTALRVMYASTTEKSQREFVFSLDYSTLNVMMGLGVVVGGLVAVAGFGTRTERYGVLFLADGLTFLFTAAACALLLPGSVAQSRPKEERSGGYLAVLGDRRLLTVLVITFVLMTTSISQYKSGLPGYLTSTGAVSAGGLSFTFALNIVVVAVVQFLVMPYLEKYSRYSLLAASGLLFAACWAFAYAAGATTGTAALALAAVGMVALSVGEALIMPILTAMLNNLVHDDLRGRANALLSMTISTSSVIAPVIAGAALPWHNGTGLVVAMVAGSLLGTALILSLRTRENSQVSADTVSADASTSA